MIRAAIYTRVSTIEQAEEGYSLAAQLRTLTKLCNNHKYTVTAVYTDEGISGKDIKHRPQMCALMDAVRRDEVDIIVIWALSRLTRSVADLYGIWGVCVKHNCDILSATEAFDTSTSVGRAMMGMLGIFAQMEREITADRVRAALEERARDGARTCSQVIGYDMLGTDSLKINPAEAEYVRFIFSEYIKRKKSFGSCR